MSRSRAPSPAPVHRIDKDTSGLLLVALSANRSAPSAQPSKREASGNGAPGPGKRTLARGRPRGPSAIASPSLTPRTKGLHASRWPGRQFSTGPGRRSRMRCCSMEQPGGQSALTVARHLGGLASCAYTRGVLTKYGALCLPGAPPAGGALRPAFHMAQQVPRLGRYCHALLLPEIADGISCPSALRASSRGPPGQRAGRLAPGRRRLVG